MNQYRLDYINIGLMISAAIAAFIVPFQLFIFSYAVLGPLHYLTEIGWLHQRNYFTNGKSDFKLLILISIVILIIHQLKMHQDSDLLQQIPYSTSIIHRLFNSYSSFILSAFALALVMVLLPNHKNKYLIMTVLIIVSLIIYQFSFVYIVFGLFLPTVIHVYFFTSLFILFGALKSNSKPGIFSFFLMLVIPFLLIGITSHPIINENHFSNNYIIQSFEILNKGIARFFGFNNMSFDNLFNLKIERFLAFAYTYHYLNWFSKTKIIRWHEAPLSWTISTFSIWILAVATYFYDSKLGFSFMFLLSLLHVFLEFPLNIVSIKGIFSFIGKSRAGN
jgi:hypothetical protein